MKRIPLLRKIIPRKGEPGYISLEDFVWYSLLSLMGGGVMGLALALGGVSCSL